MDRQKIVIAFDLYGTILSTDSVVRNLEDYFHPDEAQELSTLWRRYQLEYTWRLNSMNQYQPFSTVTKRALLHALSQLHKSLTTDEIDGLLASYNSLSVYPDVGPAMGLLKDSPDVVPVIFSNGTEDMISKSMADSPDLRPHVPVFKSMVSVDAVARFKPDPKVYKHLAEQLGMGTEKEGMERIWLVSGNPFDVVGARAVGMHAAWVKRKGIEWCDALIEGELGKPTITVEGVEDAVRGILGATG